jgi:hypothetical protein
MVLLCAVVLLGAAAVMGIDVRSVLDGWASSDRLGDKPIW